MDSLPSPSSSPSDSPTSTINLGRKRARSSASSDASSSKRAMSEDPSQAGNLREDSTPVTISTTTPGDVDHKLSHTYLLEDGETDMSMTTPSSSSSAQRLTTAMQRYNEVQSRKGTPMSVGATWYVVSQSWYSRWEKACTGRMDKEGAINESEIGPVDNSAFFDKDGKFDYNSSMIEGVDVQFVDARVWNLFKQWYGEPEYVIARMVIPAGRETRLELRPPVIKVLRLARSDFAAISDPPSVCITVSACTSLLTLFNLLKERVGVDLSSEIRVWRVDDSGTHGKQYPSAKLLKEGGQQIPHEDKTVEGAMIQNNDVLVVEVKEDGKWIIDNEGDVKNPESGSNDISGPLFASETGFFSKMNSDSPKKPVKSASASSSVLSPAVPIKKGTIIPGKAKVTGKGPVPGTLGLVNMGNTCFMNSALQCLAHTEVLIDYFLTGVYQDELNPDNPLGMQGAIAEAFGTLLSRIWSPGFVSTLAPRDFKMQLQRFAPQFSGYQQHDSQELVAFLLDGLHEDLNRIKKKPYVEKPDWEGGGDRKLIELAKESWEGYLRRNDSIIVDLFQGQYRSTLVCPECQKVSITFDPFMYLTLPLPVQKKWSQKIFYIPWDLNKPHVRIPVEMNRNATFKDVRQLLSRWMDVNPDNLLTMEVFSNRFYKDLDDTVSVADLTDTDVIICYELPCHAQQSRTWKPDLDPTKNPLIVPVHLCNEPAASRYSYSRYPSGFSHPFVIVLDYDQVRDKDKIYAAIVERLERWTIHPELLYSREAYEQVSFTKIRSTTSITEIRENGDINVVEEEVPEEGDIVDEKITILEDNDLVAEAKDGEIKRLGPKPELFEMHIQSGNEKLGTVLPIAWQRWVKWESREKGEADEQKISNENGQLALLREGDALYCEWDAPVRQLFFGDEPRFEAARWGESHWKEFIHPEYEAAQNASSSRQNKNITLHDCLLEFTKEEQLGEDDLWYCPRCKKHQQATKKFDVWTLPDILVVHLKRFSNSRILRDKIDAFVEFPVQGLDLGEFCGEHEVTKRLAEQGVDVSKLGVSEIDEPLIYDLYAVDEHIGGLGGGHYRAYAFNQADEEWYHFDDSYVNRANASEAVNANAYLLFYKRRSTKRPLGGKSHVLVEAAQQKIHIGDPSDAQLPTPPNEGDDSTRSQMDTDVDDSAPSGSTQYGHASAFDTNLRVTNVTQRRGFRSFPTPPPGTPPSARVAKEQDSELPPFEDALWNENVMSEGPYLEFPDPSNSSSPSSSVEVEADDNPLDLDIDDESPFNDYNIEGGAYRSRSNSQMDFDNAEDCPLNWADDEGWGLRLTESTSQHAKEDVTNNFAKEIPLGQSSLLDIDE